MLLREAESTEPIPVMPAADGLFCVFKPRDYRPAQIFFPLLCLLWLPLWVSLFFFWAKNRQKATQTKWAATPHCKKRVVKFIFLPKAIVAKWQHRHNNEMDKP
jgi:hypothetical protein